MHRLSSPLLHLIHVLRYVILPASYEVLSRTWEVRCLFTGIDYTPNRESYSQVLDVFPEHSDEVPFRVSGIRLMERAGLVMDFEESEIVRLKDADSDEYDVRFLLDTGELVFETDDLALYTRLKHYFDLSTPPIFDHVLI